MEVSRVCKNPLRDEPDPGVIGAVKRFGLVGLVLCAVLAGAARWWSQLDIRAVRNPRVPNSTLDDHGNTSHI
jgi:hypothetical protein